MVLKELNVGSLYGYRRGFEARFELNEDEFNLIKQSNGRIYSLGVEEKPTKEKKSMKKDDIRVIYNNPLTILYMNGKRYISKTHEEEFDEEKGLLMCLAKANGITHSELKRMIKNAKKQNKE